MAISAIRSMSVAGQDAAGRVRRRVEDQQSRPRGDERGQFVDVEPEVVRHPDRDRDRRRTDEPRQRLVDRVARIRHEDLVARIDQAEDRVQHHALATDRHEDLRRVGGDAFAGRHIDGDRFAQRRDAGERRVVRLALVERALGGFADVGGRVEIGLADLEMDDRSALGLERARAGADLERALGPDRPHPRGDPQSRRCRHHRIPVAARQSIIRGARVVKTTLAADARLRD